MKHILMAEAAHIIKDSPNAIYIYIYIYSEQWLCGSDSLSAQMNAQWT